MVDLSTHLRVASTPLAPDPTSSQSPRVRQRQPGHPSAVAILGVVTAITSVAAIVLDFLAPPDALQGYDMRLMYVHVPAAWGAYLAFAVVLVCSISYLIHADLRLDSWSQAAGEVGVVLTGVTLAAGSLWGHLVWGTWWTWDPRLISTALLFLVYVAQLSVRGLTGSRRRDARLAAWLGIAGFLLVPVVHFSVLWWRSLHQPPTILRPGTHPIDGRMALALGVSVLAMTLLGVTAMLLRHRSLARTDNSSSTADSRP